MKINFKPPGSRARAFMLSTAFVRCLRGPVGSAKSSTCIMEMFRKICDQKPNAEGIRKSRWAVIRNTNPQLRTTTIKSYEQWLPPEHFGEIKMAPPPFVHEINMELPDRTRIQSEVIFLSLDSPEDMRKLLSLELTGAFINEARELPKAIVDGVTQRLRRYPSMMDGGASWSGLIMDTNAPDDDHWWAIMSGEKPPPEGLSEDELRGLVKPDDWEFFTQPPAMLEVKDAKGKITGYEINPQAENIQNLDPKYYTGMIAGKMKAWIDVYILNRYGATHSGRAVQPQFTRERHVSETKLEYTPNVGIWISVDFGLTPAAVFYQRVREQWVVLKELVLTNAGAVDLAKGINRIMRDDFPSEKIRACWGDPAGDQRAGTDKNTPFAILRAAKIPARPTETNEVEIRRTAGESALSRMTYGEPAIIFDPSCTVLIAGLEGAWCYARTRASDGSFEDEPLKNRYSHVCEAWEYGMVGGGEAREALGRKKGGSKPLNVRSNQDPLDRFKKQREAPRGGADWMRR